MIFDRTCVCYFILSKLEILSDLNSARTSVIKSHHIMDEPSDIVCMMECKYSGRDAINYYQLHEVLH